MTAQRLEKSTVTERRKGRLQEGAAADVIAFDPKTIADRATYQSPRIPSVGIRFELRNGTLLINDGHVVPKTYPGRLINTDSNHCSKPDFGRSSTAADDTLLSLTAGEQALT